MSRNAEEGFNLYEELSNKSIELVFLKEPHINTETYKKALNTKYVWVVDPIDGTKDYVNKTNNFAINIALAYKKEVVLGVIAALSISAVNLNSSFS